GDNSPEDDYSGRVKAVVHCPLCVLRADIAILPPPIELPRIARMAEPVRFAGAYSPALRGVPVRVCHHPRAPPTL
ncbi:MAG: hypothetical protein B7Z15_20190, partial [Rhizobiales bacterium 32-66-8]